MNKRLKDLRKNILNLTLKEFGEKISLSAGALGDIESGRRILQERHIKLITQIFNVNEEWLRNGIEPIFNEKSDDILDEFISEYGLSDFMRDIIRRYLALDNKYQEMFENFIKEMVKDLKINEEMQGKENKSNLLPKEEFAGRIGITSAEIMEAFKNNKDIFNNKKEAL